jgi:hypothetical protein
MFDLVADEQVDFDDVAEGVVAGFGAGNLAEFGMLQQKHRKVGKRKCGSMGR